MSNLSSEIASIAQLDTTRRNNLQSWAGVEIAFAVLMCAFFYIGVIIWLSYLKVPLGFKKIENPFISFMIWYVAFLIIAMAVTLGGGAFGCLIINGIYLIIFIVGSVAYLIGCHRRRKGDVDEDDSESFNTVPQSFNRFQSVMMIISLSFTAACILIVGLSNLRTVNSYYVLDRETEVGIVELKPGSLDKLYEFWYALPGFATLTQANAISKLITGYCSTAYTKNLTDSEKYSDIQVGWIELYDINMTEYNRTSYLDYVSINDFFTRELADGVRPISPNPKAIVSGADCRLTVFNNIPSTLSVWIKGENFNLEQLLGSSTYLSTFTGGDMAIFRLAVQDYHRFHSPYSGVVLSATNYTGTYFSVSSDAVQSDNHVLETNKKEVVIFNVTTTRTLSAYVIIGATCVASIVFFPNVGDSVVAGEELGYFQFGGSTVVAVFPPNTVTWDSDLLAASSQGVETLVQMGTQIGVSNN